MLYRTAYHVDIDLLWPGMNRNSPEMEQVIHTVQQIIPEWLPEEGLVLEILFMLVQRFIFAHFEWRLPRIFRGRTMNLIFFFAVRLFGSLNVSMRVSVMKGQVKA